MVEAAVQIVQILSLEQIPPVHTGGATVMSDHLETKVPSSYNDENILCLTAKNFPGTWLDKKFYTYCMCTALIWRCDGHQLIFCAHKWTTIVELGITRKKGIMILSQYQVSGTILYHATLTLLLFLYILYLSQNIWALCLSLLDKQFQQMIIFYSGNSNEDPYGKFSTIKTRNSPNGYVVIAGGIQETELNPQTKHCSAKHDE